MTHIETEPTRSPARPVLSHCPQCRAGLTVLRVIEGRAGAEYWTMRCTGCGGIHLDIVKPPSDPVRDSGSSHRR